MKTVCAAILCFTLSEDALDRYFLLWFERHVRNKVARASLRMVFNRSRTMANLAEMRALWERTGRPLTK